MSGDERASKREVQVASLSPLPLPPVSILALQPPTTCLSLFVLPTTAR